MVTIFTSLGIGLIVGVLAALCGVGGGIIMVPAYTFLLRMESKKAIATSLAVIIFTSIAATFKNTGNQLIDWRVVAFTAVTSTLVAWFAADWLKQLSNLTLTRIFAIVVILMGTLMLVSSFAKK